MEKKERKAAAAKPAWRAFIPLMIEVPVSTILVYLYGLYEINSFYNDPNHIGFAIPMVTFMLAAAAMVVTLILLIVGIIVAVKRAKRNRALQREKEAISTENQGE